jgi:UDP-glucuronate 4-epimerase
LYAASKKSNELMAHTYSHLYNIPTTGLRFFTVYGPWGRPDMALFKFTKAILNNEKIKVYNYGRHRRDFTFIDDIIEGIVKVIDNPAKKNLEWSGEKPNAASSFAPWCIYNIGNNKPVELMDYIAALEEALCKKAEIEFLPMQLGDIPDTYADISEMSERFNYSPKTEIKEGVKLFANWYMEYYK